MYRDVGGKLVGVLDDWDLPSTLAGSSGGALERTDALPYMALELLHTIVHGKKCQHRYRHDLEACFWVLVRIYYCYEGGHEREDLGDSLFGGGHDHALRVAHGQ